MTTVGNEKKADTPITIWKVLAQHHKLCFKLKNVEQCTFHFISMIKVCLTHPLHKINHSNVLRMSSKIKKPIYREKWTGWLSNCNFLFQLKLAKSLYACKCGFWTIFAKKRLRKFLHITSIFYPIFTPNTQPLYTRKKSICAADDTSIFKLFRIAMLAAALVVFFCV